MLKIATRKSPLALWQAEYVKAKLTHLYPDLPVKLVTFTTKGDTFLATSLSKIGGKGLFTKELEDALLNGEADLAVHSMKDVPAEFPEGLQLAAICERDDPHDAFVSEKYLQIDELPQGAIVGTSSLRRQAQLLVYRSDLKIKSLRGNVGTRLGKLDAGEFDAIILAAAGLKRLGLENRIQQSLPIDICLPAVAQGAIGIEIRAGDNATYDKVNVLAHQETTIRVAAERAFNRHLQGGCETPIAVHAVLQQDQLLIDGLVANPNGTIVIRGQANGPLEQAESLGIELADSILSRGGDAILANFVNKNDR